MNVIWNAIVAFILGIPEDKRLHFVCGAFIAAFFAIVFGIRAAIVPAIIAGLLKETIDSTLRHEQWDWLDLLATILGGLHIQFSCWLHCLLY